MGQGSVITYHFDPILAKLIVWAPSRPAGIDQHLDAQVRATGESLHALASIVHDNRLAVRAISDTVSQQDAGIAQLFADRHPPTLVRGRPVRAPSCGHRAQEKGVPMFRNRTSAVSALTCGQLSMFWPPVTGRAWPVSYFWSIR